MKPPPYHSNGLSYFTDSNGQRVCTGARMGRRNNIPRDYDGERLYLRRVPIRQGYDPGGAYWGTPYSGKSLWCAWGESATEQVEIYVRAFTRKEAKEEIGIVLMLQCNPTFRR